MPDLAKLDNLYLDICERLAQMSYARRAKVGALVVKGDNIISMGWNGMPAGMDNCCEIETPAGLVTNPQVQHAEWNCHQKLARLNTQGQLNGATLYCTFSPCPKCAALLIEQQVARVVYRTEYRLPEGVDLLKEAGVIVDHR